MFKNIHSKVPESTLKVICPCSVFLNSWLVYLGRMEDNSVPIGEPSPHQYLGNQSLKQRWRAAAKNPRWFDLHEVISDVMEKRQEPVSL